MPSPTTSDEFLELVRKSGVVEDKRLTAYLDKARAEQALPGEPVRLAGVLVRDGVLTHFQAEQFLQGKWRRFTIGKYKVLERLGAGGMGSVFLCEHKLMRRRVAVKVLPTAKAEDTSSLERFYREARAVAALDHPNIVRAYDIDQDDKLHFLVMEHVDGSSLQEIVKKTGPMDVVRACHYIYQAALGLQHAHEAAGLVHRDIKPGNILVDRNGIVKVLDMGLARFFNDEDDVLTKKYEENVLGTADYLAPEQALDSHSVDIRADIYSLGATFYFCLTARTPFQEGTVAQKLIWHQTRQPKPLRQLRPEVPDGVIAVIDRMMAKDPAQRFATPADAAEALTPWTQMPIPPPPAHEMPQLSLAAMGAAPGDTAASAGPKTPPSGQNLSPTPRKMWQVSQNAIPTLAAPASSPPPLPPRELRKSTPPTPPDPAAQPLIAPAPDTPPAIRPSAINGVLQAPPAPVIAEEGPSWEELVRHRNGPADTQPDAAPRTPRRGFTASMRRVGGLPPLTDSTRNTTRIVAIVSLIVIAFLLIVALLAWLPGKKPAVVSNVPAVLPPFHVNRLGTNGASQTISAALDKIRERGIRQPVRIVVQDDPIESGVVIDSRWPSVTIEPAEGKKLIWRARPKDVPKVKLLTVSRAEGFRIKGFTFDGEQRIETLINLFHHCPGTVVENLTLKGFKKYGIWITNCMGGSENDRRVLLSGLTFEIPQPGQTGIYFSINDSIKYVIPKNQFITIRDDCVFTGAGGVKIKTANLAELDQIQFPSGVQPVQGK